MAQNQQQNAKPLKEQVKEIFNVLLDGFIFELGETDGCLEMSNKLKEIADAALLRARQKQEK